MDSSLVCVFALCLVLNSVTAEKEHGGVFSSTGVNTTKPDKAGDSESMSNPSLSNSSNTDQNYLALPRSKIGKKHKRTKHKGKDKKDDTGIPQAMTPLRVVATSAVIKHRLTRPPQRPKPVKAIHIWGQTPFKTVVNNLMKITDRIQQQQKRLLLPYQTNPSQEYTPVQPDFALPAYKDFMEKPDIQSQKLPPLVQFNERQNDDDQRSSEAGTSRMLLGRPIYAEEPSIVQQQFGPGPLGKSREVYYSQYPQYHQGLQQYPNVFHHHHIHHHSGKSKAKCSPNPCVNDGVCTAFLHDYECTCPIGFMGKHCEDRNQCLPNPCKNNGNCYPTSNGFQCTCVRGYKGDNCEAISKCIPNPCKNGAVCEEPILVHEDYKCVCKPGYKGSNCEEADYCGLHNPCKNGGTCVNGQATHVCRCSVGFMGKDCGDIDVCHSSPCANGGTCLSEGAGRFSCQCPYSYSGYTCEERKSRCELYPCQNGGRCIEEDARGFRCECTSKYSGSLCQNTRSICASNPCQNNGKCVDMAGSFVCICQKKYSGTTCEVFMDVECNGCHRDAKCVFGKCVCLPGFAGDGLSCKVLLVGNSTRLLPDASKCHPNPCYNDGTCTEHASGFTCECRNGFTGPTCQAIQACLSQPCQHGGTCLDNKDKGTYICKCDKGYTGINCEESLVCQPSDVCENGGTCIPNGDSYSCKCAKRYQGTRCEEDKCSLCDVHAHCEDGKCVCDTGYVGEGTKGECFKPGTSNPRFCLPNPCKNGGTCTELPNQYNCECPSGFKGDTCKLERGVGASPPEPQENPCSSLPCKHGGKCVALKNTFTCICTDEYKGKTCEIEVRHYCHPNPCLHGGKCVETSNGYTCKCDGSYRGQNCDEDDCDQCDIHAICVKGACRCRVGYKGDGFLCEKIKRCHHCSKYATCIANECVCNPGYTGTGQDCRVDKCASCPANANCMAGMCVCGDGLYFDGKHCSAQPKNNQQICPDECSASNCQPSCPKQCCKITALPITCPASCRDQCSPSCPLRCCLNTPCPASCRNKCQSFCPVRCCSPDSVPPPQSGPSYQNSESLYLPNPAEKNLQSPIFENAVARSLNTNTTDNRSSSKTKNSGLSPERRAKLIHSLSALLSNQEKCPGECQTSSCTYLCPAHCCRSDSKRTIEKHKNSHNNDTKKDNK